MAHILVNLLFALMVVSCANKTSSPNLTTYTTKELKFFNEQNSAMSFISTDTGFLAVADLDQKALDSKNYFNHQIRVYRTVNGGRNWNLIDTVRGILIKMEQTHKKVYLIVHAPLRDFSIIYQIGDESISKFGIYNAFITHLFSYNDQLIALARESVYSLLPDNQMNLITNLHDNRISAAAVTRNTFYYLVEIKSKAQLFAYDLKSGSHKEIDAPKIEVGGIVAKHDRLYLFGTSKDTIQVFSYFNSTWEKKIDHYSPKEIPHYPIIDSNSITLIVKNITSLAVLYSLNIYNGNQIAKEELPIKDIISCFAVTGKDRLLIYASQGLFLRKNSYP